MAVFLACALYRSHKTANNNNTSTVQKYARTVKKTATSLLDHYLHEPVETTPSCGDNEQIAMIDLNKSEINQLKEKLNLVTKTVTEIKVQQQQLQKQMADMLGLIKGMHDKTNVNQNDQSEMTVTYF